MGDPLQPAHPAEAPPWLRRLLLAPSGWREISEICNQCSSSSLGQKGNTAVGNARADGIVTGFPVKLLRVDVIVTVRGEMKWRQCGDRAGSNTSLKLRISSASLVENLGRNDPN